MIHTVKGFGVVNEADVFLQLSCFLYDPADIGRMLISGSSAFSKSSFKKKKKIQLKHLEVLSSRTVEASLGRILSITLLAYEKSAIVQ